MHGAEYLSDEEMLCRATIREEELERTVRELERSASELERERDAAYVWEDIRGSYSGSTGWISKGGKALLPPSTLPPPRVCRPAHQIGELALDGLTSLVRSLDKWTPPMTCWTPWYMTRGRVAAAEALGAKYRALVNCAMSRVMCLGGCGRC